MAGVEVVGEVLGASPIVRLNRNAKWSAQFRDFALGTDAFSSIEPWPARYREDRGLNFYPVRIAKDSLMLLHIQSGNKFVQRPP